MSMGYMGYVIFEDKVTLATSASVQENHGHIFSSSSRGAGWYHAGVHTYSPDTKQYEGNIEIELVRDVWNFLKEWIVGERTTSKSVLISPDGMSRYQFTGGGTGEVGSLSGLWVSSADFSTSEGSVIGVSLGVVGVQRDVIKDGEYLKNISGLYRDEHIPINLSNTTPYPFWKSTASLTSKGKSPFRDTVDVIEWSIGCTNSPSIIYACTGTRGPLALVMGEMEASGSVVLYDNFGVDGLYSDDMPDVSFSVSIDDSQTLSLPRVVVLSDGNDLSGGDSVTTREFSFRGLSGPTLPAFLMS